MGGLIDLVGNIALGDAKARSADVLGHVFEYFLGEFALAEGKQGGQFYTPRSIVELLVNMLEPYKGRVFDPCCGSGGMFVQSEKFVEEHQGRVNDISIYGQESNQTTWRLAKMNLAIRGIDSSQVKWNNEGSFLNDAHKDLKADFIIANPPFNDQRLERRTVTQRWPLAIRHTACRQCQLCLAAAFCLSPCANRPSGRRVVQRRAHLQNQRRRRHSQSADRRRQPDRLHRQPARQTVFEYPNSRRLMVYEP